VALAALVFDTAHATVSRHYGPMESYLDRPFDDEDVCVIDSGLTAEDYHVIGGVKQLTRDDTNYKDDGSVLESEKSIVDFAPNGNILQVQYFLDGEPINQTTYKYNARGQIGQTLWRAPDTGPTCAFVYDPAGKLVSVVDIRGSDSRLITITYTPDGRFKEAIKRKAGTQKGLWRLAYTYSGSTVTIERFADENGKQTTEKAVIELFPDKRARKITYDMPYGHGTYTYARLSHGLMLARDDRVNAQDGSPCTTSYWIHRNGEIDERTRISRPKGERCWNDHSPIAQVYFDKHGNNIIERYGRQVDELGRKVMRWKEVLQQQITYYPQ
jgi:antitoxin component YwqK of YwqJK toxin-antitoxin module